MGKAKKIKKRSNNVRDNGNKKSTDKLLIALICIVAAAVISVFAVAIVLLNQPPEFVPPEFDSGAIAGEPSVSDSDERRYKLISDAKMPYTLNICQNIYTSSDGEGEIYFTNPSENTLWMKLRIYDDKGKVIGETGLIKPGEYLKNVRFDTVPKNGTMITMKVMTYEPDTYYSGGEVPIGAKVIVK